MSHVYVLNNDLTDSNTITVFNRAADGTLTLLDTTPIGGLGSRAAFADGSQGSLILTPDRSRLFAVDAGSDQISVVNVHDGQLSLAGIFPSGGAGPVSLTYQDGLLYVLNAAEESHASANVAGFRVASDGTLQPIAGATRPLSAPHPHPVQVQIDPLGQFLLVTEQGTDRIDVYLIHSDGSLSDPMIFPSVGATPFGLAFNPASSLHEFIVADAEGAPDGTGAVSAYRLENGDLRLIDGPVPDHQMDPCWMVITPDGHFAYTSNAHSQSISGYHILEDGKLSLLKANGISGTTPSDTFPIEEALSSDGRFLYVLDSRALLTPPGPATLSSFLIEDDGSLTSILDSARIILPWSAIGLAAD
jgi:6-phosphogluconolactonase (cycloisomerase 2 family)